MGLKSDILAIAHSATDKQTAAATAEDLDSLRNVVLAHVDALNAVMGEYAKRLPVAHAGITALATTKAAHL
jgi:hypothetical protein